MKQDPLFFEIGARTNFSFLEGASKPEEMVRQASSIGLAGLGIAARNSVAGVVRAFAPASEMAALHERQQKQGVAECEEETPFPFPFRPGTLTVISANKPA